MERKPDPVEPPPVQEGSTDPILPDEAVVEVREDLQKELEMRMVNLQEDSDDYGWEEDCGSTQPYQPPIQLPLSMNE